MTGLRRDAEFLESCFECLVMACVLFGPLEGVEKISSEVFVASPRCAAHLRLVRQRRAELRLQPVELRLRLLGQARRARQGLHVRRDHRVRCVRHLRAFGLL